jgi:hypothetical protein
MHGSANVKLLAVLEVLTAVLLKIQVFRHVTLCCWASSCQHFKQSQCLHLQCPAAQGQRLLDAEDKGTAILQIIRNYLPNNGASHHRRLESLPLFHFVCGCFVPWLDVMLVECRIFR